MTADEKRSFLKSLTSHVLEGLLVQVDKMPEEWDGQELRQLLAERFENAGFRMNRTRKHNYLNECVIRGL